MANTTNLNLAKPAGTDKALVSVLNSNSDKIDAWAGSTNQAISTLNSEIVRAIASGTDLNTLTEPGFYNTTNAISLTNAPVNGTNRLSLLVQTSENGYIFQQATENLQSTYGVFTRRCLNGNWTSWEQLAFIKQGSISVTISDTTNGFIDSGISSSNYMMLSAHTLASSNNSVRISNLSGGNYRFQIISAIDGGVQKSGSITVHFSYMQRY